MTKHERRSKPKRSIPSVDKLLKQGKKKSKTSKQIRIDERAKRVKEGTSAARELKILCYCRDQERIASELRIISKNPDDITKSCLDLIQKGLLKMIRQGKKSHRYGITHDGSKVLKSLLDISNDGDNPLSKLKFVETFRKYYFGFTDNIEY